MQEKDLEVLMNTGDAALSLIHELNNCLNSMMLQAAVVQMQVGEPQKEQLSVVRKEGAHAASRLRLLLRFRDQRRQGRTELDLNQVVRNVLAARPEWANRVQFRPAATLPRLVSLPADLERLVTWFLRRGLAVAEAAPRLRTEACGKEVCLLLNTPRPLPLEGVESEDVAAELERLALQTLLKETQGQYRVEDAASDGAVMLLAWPGV